MRLAGRGRDYIAKRRAAGDTKTEAIRALRRRISDEVDRRMRHDDPPASGSARPTWRWALDIGAQHLRCGTATSVLHPAAVVGSGWDDGCEGAVG